MADVGKSPARKTIIDDLMSTWKLMVVKRLLQDASSQP